MERKTIRENRDVNLLNVKVNNMIPNKKVQEAQRKAEEFKTKESK